MDDVVYQRWNKQRPFAVSVATPAMPADDLWQSELLSWKVWEAMDRAVGGFVKEKPGRCSGFLQISDSQADSAIRSLHLYGWNEFCCYTENQDLKEMYFSVLSEEPCPYYEQDKPSKTKDTIQCVATSKMRGVLEYGIKATSHEVSSLGKYSPERYLTGNFHALAMSPMGRFGLGANSEGQVVFWHLLMWNLPKKMAMATFAVPYTVCKLQFGSYAHWGLLSNPQNEIYAWELYRGYAKSSFRLAVFPGKLHALVAEIAGTRVWAAGENDNIFCYDMHERQKIGVLQGHRGTIYTLDVTVDGRYLLAGGNDHSVRVWETASGKLLATFSTPSAVRAALFTDSYNSSACLRFIAGLENGQILTLSK
jgi:hypothetical protein